MSPVYVVRIGSFILPICDERYNFFSLFTEPTLLLDDEGYDGGLLNLLTEIYPPE